MALRPDIEEELRRYMREEPARRREDKATLAEKFDALTHSIHLLFEKFTTLEQIGDRRHRESKDAIAGVNARLGVVEVRIDRMERRVATDSTPPRSYNLGKYITDTGTHIVMTKEDAIRELKSVNLERLEEERELRRDAKIWRWISRHGAKVASHVVVAVGTAAVLALLASMFNGSAKSTPSHVAPVAASAQHP